MSLPVLTLGWLNPKLSPNARVCRYELSRHKKAARLEGLWLTRQKKRDFSHCKKIKVLITFFPPDKRARDLDNMIASFKAYQDGIADAIGLDDRHWITSYAVSSPVARGSITVEFSEP